MFLSLAVVGDKAPDLGYVLYKHPDRIYEKATSRARVIGLFPENTPTRAEFVLVVEVDPVERVRGLEWNAGIAQYVEPQPYLATSHMAQALSTALDSAMNGNLRSNDPEINARIVRSGAEKWPLEIKVGPLRCDSWFLEKAFEPLGWTVELRETEIEIPVHDPEQAGSVRLQTLVLTGESTVSDALSQLYILLPATDSVRHYFYDDNEIGKLEDKGGEWLRHHPYRSAVINRYLTKSAGLRERARFLYEEPPEGEEGDVSVELSDEDMTPHGRRHRRIVEDVTAWGARKVVDLGCGEGRLLFPLSRIAPDMRVVGVEPSLRDLERARRLMSKNPSKTLDPRVELLHGTALYEDARLTGFDVAILSEVIEHVDPDRLPQFARNVFGAMAPKRVVVTTPNGSFNLLMGMTPGEFRHADHRFEWTLDEVRAWIDQVTSAYPYTAVLSGAGGVEDPEFGGISHYIVFTKTEA